MDHSLDRCAKQPVRRRKLPVLVVGREIEVGQVADDAGHGDCAAAPRRAKVKVEAVVFDVRDARVGLRVGGLECV